MMVSYQQNGTRGYEGIVYSMPTHANRTEGEHHA